MAEPINLNEILIGPQQPVTTPSLRQPQERENGISFADTLKQAEGRMGTLKFSAHAQMRIQSRRIDLGATDIQRIEGAVQKVADKGGRESLVLMDDTAFVVSVPNRTVITVVDKENLKQNVFTNIDSAVIA
jgi:flagellar operon protein